MTASKLSRMLFPVTLAVLGLAGWLNWRAPLEVDEGIVQKTMYVHLPTIWVAYLAFTVGLVSSIGFLINRKRSWDRVAVSSTEIGVVFCTLVLLTGPIWAKAIWGVWWQWDARLTSTLVLWFMYVGYLVLRVLAPDRETGAKWSAVLAIFAFLDIPIVHKSVEWWRTLHPQPKVASPNGVGSGLPDPAMRWALVSALVAFTFLYLFLLFLRLAVERLTDDVEAAEA